MTEQDQSSHIEYDPIAEHGYLIDKAKELGLDSIQTKKLLIGQVASVMSGDDENAFTAIINHPRGFTPETGVDAKKRILKRLEWEVNLKLPDGSDLLPVRLKKSVKIAIDNIKNLDFSNEAGFKVGRNEWLYNIKDFFEDDYGNDSKEMLTARDYYNQLVKGKQS